jgi:hypothetical protein
MVRMMSERLRSSLIWVKKLASLDDAMHFAGNLILVNSVIARLLTLLLNRELFRGVYFLRI